MDCFNDMRWWLTDSKVGLIGCIDEANNLFETLIGTLMYNKIWAYKLIFYSGHFRNSNEEAVSFDHPFLYGVMEEFNGPLVIAGTKLRLKKLEEVLYATFLCCVWLCETDVW